MFILFSVWDSTKPLHVQMPTCTPPTIHVSPGEWRLIDRNYYAVLYTTGIRSCCGIAMVSRSNIALGHFLLAYRITKEQCDHLEENFLNFLNQMINVMGSDVKIYASGNLYYNDLLKKYAPKQLHQFIGHGESFTFTWHEPDQFYYVKIRGNDSEVVEQYDKDIFLDTWGYYKWFNTLYVPDKITPNIHFD